MEARINRNIVECKFLAYPLRHLPEFRINRNIVECKSKYCSDSFCKQIELIETLWNVNDVVKIRINRNIVECKYVL